MSKGKELVRREQSQVPAATEQTRPEPVSTPAVDIYETADELVLLADLPGVGKDELNIRLDNNILTIEGIVKDQAGQEESPLLSEFRPARYWRQFTLGEVVDRDKIEAKMANGELRLILPKSPAAKPHKIEVKAA